MKIILLISLILSLFSCKKNSEEPLGVYLEPNSFYSKIDSIIELNIRRDVNSKPLSTLDKDSINVKSQDNSFEKRTKIINIITDTVYVTKDIHVTKNDEIIRSSITYEFYENYNPVLLFDNKNCFNCNSTIVQDLYLNQIENLLMKYYYNDKNSSNDFINHPYIKITTIKNHLINKFGQYSFYTDEKHESDVHLGLDIHSEIYVWLTNDLIIYISIQPIYNLNYLLIDNNNYHHKFEYITFKNSVHFIDINLSKYEINNIINNNFNKKNYFKQ